MTQRPVISQKETIEGLRVALINELDKFHIGLMDRRQLVPFEMKLLKLTHLEAPSSVKSEATLATNTFPDAFNSLPSL